MSATITLENNPNDGGWKSRTVAYKTGYIDRFEGRSLAAQPYGAKTTSKAHWTLGWRKADADLRKA